MSKHSKPSAHEAALAQLYARLPRIRCRGLCQAQCMLVPMTPLELHVLADGEAIPDVTVRDNIALLGSAEVGERSVIPRSCPLLTEDGRCSRYSKRPLVCRLWGFAVPMLCEHGCEAERVLTREEGFVYLHQVARLSAAWERQRRARR